MASDNEIMSLAFDLISNTNVNMFLTGKAGTGKTTFLKKLREETYKKLIVVAPTGVAAINAGGVTVHSFFQLPFGPYVPGITKLSNHNITENKRDVMRELDLLVIDEVSMLRVDQLDAIDHVLRRERNNNAPFGGVQLLMLGDLFQLPPFANKTEYEAFDGCYDTLFFFGSKALQMASFITIELEHIYRQDDKEFKDLLNQIRIGCNGPKVMRKLNQRVFPEIPKDIENNSIRVVTHVRQAEDINAEQMALIDSEPKTYKAEITGDFNSTSYPTQLELTLKVGAHVMFVKNDSQKGIYNGLLGIITELEDDAIKVKLNDKDRTISVERVKWENIEYKFDINEEDITPNTIGTFLQFPLKLAWAITIHKSQGLTFDKAILDLHCCFSSGQAYVALSRCRSFEGIYMSNYVGKRAIQCDDRVRFFLESDAHKTPNAEQLTLLKKEAFINTIRRIFDMSSICNLTEYLIKDEYKRCIESTKEPGIRVAFKNFDLNIVSLTESFLLPIKVIVDTNEEYINGTQIINVLRFNCEFIYKGLSALKNAATTIQITTTNAAIKDRLDDTLSKLRKQITIKENVLRCIIDEEFDYEKIQYLLRGKEKENNISKETENTPTTQPEEKIKSKTKNNTESHIESLNLFNEGVSISLIAEKRGLSESTVRSHLCRCAGLGLFDGYILFNKEDLLPIEQFFKENPESTLKDAFAHFKAKYDYTMLRIAQIKAGE